MTGEPFNDVEGVAALEIRIGVEHHWDIDGVGNRPKVSLDLRILEREVSFTDGKDALGPEPFVAPGLGDRIGVEADATPAITGTRLSVASIVVRTTLSRCPRAR